MVTIRVDDRTAKTSKAVMGPPNPNGYRWSMITLHHDGTITTTENAEEGTINYLSQPHANPVSCHKYFRRRKGIVKIVPENWISWCNGLSRHEGVDDTNSRSLTYEIANRGSRSNPEPYTDQQYEEVALSVAYDCARYHIADSDVVSHRRVRNEWIQAHPLRAKALRYTRDMKYDPHGWDWGRMWRRVDELRAAWPKEFAAGGVPLWFIRDARQMVT